MVGHVLGQLYSVIIIGYHVYSAQRTPVVDKPKSS